MNILYLDCQSGISGDMTLAALIDLGADLSYIKDELSKLAIDPFTLSIKKVDKKGICSSQLVLQFHDEKKEMVYAGGHIHQEEPFPHDHASHHHHSHDHHDHSHHHVHRKASTIIEMIEKSELPIRVKQRSIAVFRVIAEAEGKIHGVDPKDVHFHEVGAMDSIIDIIGVCLALENLGIDKIISSPVPTGYGKVKMAHGLYPVPAPATAEILIGIPLADFDVKGELTTPTGAGFLKALAAEFGYLPSLPIERIGYGAGKKDFDHPNVLRAFLFQSSPFPQREVITVLECQLDDMTGEALGFLMGKILDSGALDVFYTPVVMKKSRPGCLITVLVNREDAEAIEELLLKETSTFGVRSSEWSRRVLSRKFEKISTRFGEITVKIGYEGNKIFQISPEFEEVKTAAIHFKKPLMDVYSEVQMEAKRKIMHQKSHSPEE
ncbi:nickel pincer cofactor biosynthesis protein LarC [Bacillus litorisediminis]|uniref:nickel pincer cofactor biosynthesis protein LarC n=1 Tax=Bacillus litorisediminis TaxID=2922713 RepID=UPI001FAEA7B8|nr:nickel pincer cofactor biosynthesis protein LarC [Bacillus litorisediminis]